MQIEYIRMADTRQTQKINGALILGELLPR